MILAKPARFLIVGLATLLMSGCSNVLEVITVILKKPQRIQGICLLEMPMTLYSDDPGIPTFSRRDLQIFTDEFTSVVKEELEEFCDASAEECQGNDKLLLRNPGGVPRPTNACGPETTDGIIPMGYNYGKCLVDWGQKILEQQETLCTFSSGTGPIPYEPLAAGIWIDAVRGQKIVVRALLVNVAEKTIDEIDELKALNESRGALSDSNYRRTLREIAREAGNQMSDLLKKVYRQKGL